MGKSYNVGYFRKIIVTGVDSAGDTTGSNIYR